MGEWRFFITPEAEKNFEPWQVVALFGIMDLRQLSTTPEGFNNPESKDYRGFILAHCWGYRTALQVVDNYDVM